MANGKLKMSLGKLMNNLDSLELGSLINLCIFLRKANFRGIRLNLYAKDYKDLETRLNIVLSRLKKNLDAHKEELDEKYSETTRIEISAKEMDRDRTTEEKASIKSKNRAYKRYAQQVKDYEYTMSSFLFDFKQLNMNTRVIS